MCQEVRPLKQTEAVLMLRPGTGSTSNKELSIVKGNFIPAELKNSDLSLRINENGVFEILEEYKSLIWWN